MKIVNESMNKLYIEDAEQSSSFDTNIYVDVEKLFDFLLENNCLLEDNYIIEHYYI